MTRGNLWRWPIRYQVLTRLLLVLVATIGALTLAFGRAAMLARDADYRERIAEMAAFLREARFPLTESVLNQMHRLSGAEFAVQSRGIPSTITRSDNAPRSLPAPSPASDDDILANVVAIDQHEYFHTSFATANTAGERAYEVHVFLSREQYNASWWNRIRPALLAVAVVIPLAMLAGLALARNVTRPIQLLRSRVRRIAEGDRSRIPPLNRNDEISDLAQSINQMSELLGRHDQEVRQKERYETMVQMGSGIAHSLRNSIAGCQMALELAATSQQNSATNEEELAVARRQLARMEQYVDRFLKIAGQEISNAPAPESTCNLTQVMHDMVGILEPNARHLNLSLDIDIPAGPVSAAMASDDAEQVIANLATNALRAAAESSVVRDGGQGRVKLRLHGLAERESVQLVVSDNGDGPPERIRKRMFEPFATASRDGVGLGLFLVHEIARRYQTQFDWMRDNGITEFTFQFPLESASPTEDAAGKS